MPAPTSVAIEHLRERPALLDDAFAGVRAAVDSGVLPAAVVGIGDHRGAIRAEGFSGTGRPLDPAVNFWLASLTKPIFATAFMQLVEAGQLDLHAPVARHVPEFSGRGRELVTPWHLLTHTSGVADVEWDVIRRRRASAAQLTRIVLDSALRFEPGSRWEYCSASFYLLGLLIERVSGMGSAPYLDEQLLRPLDMAMTFDAHRAGRRTLPVEGVGINNRLARFLVVRFLARAALPGGGLFGNVHDLLRFGAATLQPNEVDGRRRPLEPATIALMGEDHTRGLLGDTDDGERPVHFGLGWAKPTLMGDAPGSDAVISHGGASGGRLWIDPEADLVLVYLTNMWAADRAPELAFVRGTYRALGLLRE